THRAKHLEHIHSNTTTVQRTSITVIIFLFTYPATTEIYTLSLHDALPICYWHGGWQSATKDGSGAFATRAIPVCSQKPGSRISRSEEHTSELQSPYELVCRLLLEKKNKRPAKIRCIRPDSSQRRCSSAISW